YTSPSFVSPAHLRFRYRLDGLHSDWIEAGTRRTAFFTNLPPGRYTFRVAVTRGDGTWTEAEAPLPILVEPRAHETGWFRVLLALALVLAAAGLWSWRARLLRERARELERIVWERTAELEHEKEITARQASALAELDRAKGRFFANITHEFRTPLTLILGPLRDLTVGRHGLLPAAVHAQHEMMLRNARRLLRLINQVLDLARLESGGLTLDAAPRDLVELALATTRSFTPLAERRGIALAFHAEEDRLVTNLEAEQIEKVLLNLLSNAFKFTEPGGRVEVTAAAQGGEAVIEVRDTGVGIEPGQLQRVFDRFYQADTSATRRHEGSGIGLSLAKELVELHGGTLSARSQPGEGSTFTIRLPLLAAAEAGDTHPGRDGTSRAWVPLDSSMRIRNRDAGAAHPLVERELHANGGDPVEAAVREPDEADRTTVLVVDDNADIRAYVRVVLTPGFRVVEAADGEEGLERAREALPDLVLADVMMPRLDGIGLARALRGDPATDCIPVILLTARAEAGHEVEGHGAGADDYITKPFDSSVLEARVANLIASRRRLRERFRQEGVPAPTAASAEAAPARSEMEEQLRAAVEANLTDPDFNPEALADAADLSYQQLYRRLREELDATPSQFIRTVRVERAAELLRDGAGSVTEVAYSVGFNSLSHFNRCFRERFGAAPSESLRTRA
ncbi:MAG: response regulator, partial [Chloroflexi bacterium]|nr:response regulator [Chloroflexota bacterium]